MINYLYYKFYQASLKSSMSDVARFITPIWLGGILSVNFITLSAFLAKFDICNFPFASGKWGGVFCLIIIFCTSSYYRGIRMTKVLEKFSGEKNSKRIWGNIMVGLYVLLSIMAIFLVAFFRPGKL